MTIDEAIERERRKAKEQRKDNGNCEYKAEYGCKGCADYYSNSCIECAEEHEQLAEWLEELKCYKNDNDFSGYADRLHKIAFNSGYKKAIDDFVNNIKDELNRFEVKNLDTCVLFDFIDSKAEQLKASREND